VAARRTVILIAAVVVAAIAAVAVYSYLTTVQDRANKDAKLVKVFVVKKDIAKGLPGEQALDQGFIKPDQINVKFRATTALTDVNVIRGRVALTNLAANQVVVDGQFVDPKVATVSSAQRIPAGNVAITIQVDQVRGVANLVQPGDKVNMLVSIRSGKEEYLYQNVPVLFVGSQAAPQPGETTATTQPATATQGSGLITVAVTPLAAQRIAFVSTGGGASGGGGGGSIYLTLVPPDNNPTPMGAIDSNSVIPPPSELTPVP
jgi:pilus assembly protein CpaB